MKKVISNIYIDKKILLFGEFIEFKKGEAEISDDLLKKIKETGYPNIYEKGQMLTQKSDNEIDVDKTIQALKKEYLLEIERLNNIIKTKDQTITALNDDLKQWKEEVEKLKGTKKELSKEEIETRKTLDSMSLEELKKLATEEGMDKTQFEKIKKKSELVDYMISFYTTK